MDFLDIIARKKMGEALSEEEIDYFAKGAAGGNIPDYQLAALLMAIRIQGMNRKETAQLTLSMARSGDMADLSRIEGITTDKHSTGGVGDTTTLVLAPLVAACGVPVAKMSGRGLGHTGGTLDKLESIPGFQIDLGMERFIEQVRRIGCAVIGQSSNLAPADKALYALRDVTSTVDSIPLIAASIMSKKLASGSKAIVLDVKTGGGAIMQDLRQSIALAQTMVHIGNDAGRRVMAVVTDMAEPLGSHVGNGLEVREAIEVLAGKTRGPLLDISLELGAHMLRLGVGAADEKEARAKLLRALGNGAGLETFAKVIEAQGGDPRVCENTGLLPQAKIVREAFAPENGWICAMDTTRLGNIAQNMGAGRKAKDDPIDYSVGFVLRRRVGDKVAKGDPIATIYAKDSDSASAAIRGIARAVHISEEKAASGKLLHAVVTAGFVEEL
ncbi:MAG: thymidine phosphorylase [Clostridia bacterium]|nr:thymidine phosphorylase [Clostridia bacterium]